MRSEQSWKSMYRIGAIVGVVAIAALLFDIVLASLPGWGTASVPTTAQAWLIQASANPLLAVRNLDLLNVTVSIISIPFYLALFGSMRQSRPAGALLGLLIVLMGTTMFATANAALPMLDLGRRYATAGAADRLALVSAASALLARGAHGSMGAFAGFFVSELGTLTVSLAMLGSRSVYSRRLAWMGIVGSASLVLYSLVLTFASVPENLVVALAAPGGLLMIAWQTGVVRRLWMLSRAGSGKAKAGSVSATGPFTYYRRA